MNKSYEQKEMLYDNKHHKSTRGHQQRSNNRPGISSQDRLLQAGKDLNWIPWRQRFIMDAGQEFGKLARICEFDDYWKPVPVQQDQFDSEWEWKEARKSQLVEVAKVDAKRDNFFAFLVSRLSRNSLALIKVEPEDDEDDDPEEYHPEGWLYANAQKDPLLLWRLVCKHHRVATSSTLEHVIKRDARTSYNSVRMGPGESIVVFKERFDTLYSSLVSTGNPGLEPDVVIMDYFAGLDSYRYGDFKISMQNGFANGSIALPQSLEEMHRLAANYVVKQQQQRFQRNVSAFPIAAADARRRKPSDARGPTGRRDQRPMKPSKDMSAIECWGCGKLGHYQNKCPDAAQTVAVVHRTVFSIDLNVPPSQCDNDLNVLRLDNQAQISICRTAMVTEIRQVTPIYVGGIVKGQKLRVDHKGLLFNTFDVYCSDEISVNVLCLGDVEKSHEVNYTQGVNFTIVNPDGFDYVFEKVDNVFVLDSCVGADHDAGHRVLVTTVANREAMHTKAQVKRAKTAKLLMDNVENPSNEAMIRMLSTIHKCDVRRDDVLLCEAIYGKDLATHEGKATRRKGTPAEIPNESLQPSCQTMSADVIFMEETCACLVTLCQPLDLVVGTPLPDQKGITLLNAIEDHIAVLKERNFIVTRLCVDPQSSLSMVRGKISGVKVDVGAAGDHTPPLDIKVRRLKDICRVRVARLPFQLPDTLLPHLFQYGVGRLNMRVRNGATESPVQKFTGRRPSMQGELALAFGDFVALPSVKRKRALQPRAEAGIALYPVSGVNNQWVFMNINTMKLVRRSIWNQLIADDALIRQMNQLTSPDRGREADGHAETTVAEPSVEIIDCPPDTDQKVTATGTIDGAARQEDDAEIPPPVAARQKDDVEMPLPCENSVAEGNSESMELEDDEPPSLIEVYSDEEDNCSLDSNAFEDDSIADSLLLIDDDQELNLDTDHSDVTPPRRRSNRNIERVKYHGDCLTPAEKINLKRVLTVTMTHKMKGGLDRMTVKKALQIFGQDAEDASLAEIKQLLVDKKAFHLMKRTDLSGKQLRGIIRSSMFLKAKFDASGAFEKLKARLVAWGNLQNRDEIPNRSAPTVNMTSLKIVLALAARHGKKGAVYDVGGAFLCCDLVGEEIHIEIDAFLSQLIAKHLPWVIPFLDGQGRLVCKLDKALYGLVQSARIWYEKLCSVLIGLGYVRLETDRCIFTKEINGDLCILAVHVDDILGLHRDDEVLRELHSQLLVNFEEVKFVQGDELSYLAMELLFGDGHVEIKMSGYMKHVLEDYDDIVVATTPAGKGLFEVDAYAERLVESERKKFHTSVAKLLFLSLRVKIAIATAVSFLCTRVKEANVDDLSKLKRVLGYLLGTKDVGLTLRGSGELRIDGYVDAAFCSHTDGKSHTGMIVMLGDACVEGKSTKQKIIAKDSTESEIIGASDKVTVVIYCADLATELGCDVGIPRLMQDNRSAIGMMVEGHGVARTKHLNARKHMLKELVDNNELVVVYVGTGNMIADALTKPLQGNLFRHHVGKIENGV